MPSSSKGERIGKEPIKTLEERKAVHRTYLKPWTTIGIGLFIGVMWLLNVIIQNWFNAIIGLTAFIISISLMVYGFYEYSQVRNLKQIIVYENGLDIPQPDGFVKFAKFKDIPKHKIEDVDGYQTILIQEGDEDYPVVPWAKLRKLIKKKTEPKEKK